MTFLCPSEEDSILTSILKMTELICTSQWLNIQVRLKEVIMPLYYIHLEYVFLNQIPQAHVGALCGTDKSEGTTIKIIGMSHYYAKLFGNLVQYVTLIVTICYSI